MGWKTGARLEPKTDFREPHTFDQPALLQKLMLESVVQEASDIYFMSGYPVLFKVHGVLHALTERRMTTGECLLILNWAAGNDNASAQIAKGEPAQCSYVAVHPSDIDNRGERLRFRFRVNAVGNEFRSGQGLQIVMRSIKGEPPTVADVGLEQVLIDACTPEDGIVYITGSTGSGKSTTFAALQRHILEGDTPIKGNIVTLEKPIEYTFETVSSVHSVIAQIEIGRNLPTFGAGVIECMRMDPSLLVVGETRDQETASAAIEAAVTGHPVFTTLHANNVPSVFTRMLGFYAPEVRPTMLFAVVDTSRVLINQRLVPAMAGGRIPLREYLILTDDLRQEIIANSDPIRITNIMSVLVQKHGRSMARAANEAFEAGLISETVMTLNKAI